MKNDFKRTSFWSIKQNDKTQYYIYKAGQKVEVNKAVFLCCLYSYRKTGKLQQQDFDHVDFYEDMDMFSKEYVDPLESIMKESLQEFLAEACLQLTRQEQKLIIDIYYKEKTQKQISEELHLPEYAVSRMKNRVLKKLKKIIENLQDAESMKSFYM